MFQCLSSPDFYFYNDQKTSMVETLNLEFCKEYYKIPYRNPLSNSVNVNDGFPITILCIEEWFNCNLKFCFQFQVICVHIAKRMHVIFCL